MAKENFVATLVASGSIALSETTVETVTSCLAENGVVGIRLAVLAEGKAADVFFEGLGLEAAYEKLRPLLDPQKIDVIVQPLAARGKKLLLADMESTIIEQEMLDELAGMLGVRERVAEITRRAMNGEMDFVTALKERVGLLAGQPSTLLDEAAKLMTLMGGAQELMAALKGQGAQAWLVSGGFTFFTKIVSENLGFDKNFANQLILKDGRLTGEAVEPILDKNSKKTTLDFACRELGVPLSACVTIGDGANDIPMLNACNEGGGLGIAYHAKPTVRAAVIHHINHGDLSALAYALGQP